MSEDARARRPSQLFENQREANFASTVALVEAIVAELGHPPPHSRIEAPGALYGWQFLQGSAVTRILLVARSEFTHLRVTATVLTLDAAVDRAGLFVHLLEQNAQLTGAAFALDGDRVLLVSERSTLDLDHSEILDIIRRVTAYADEHDDALVAQFGGTRAGAT
jgi:hypothetical protein